MYETEFDGERSDRLMLGFFDHFPNVRSERAANALERLDADVLQPALDRRVIRAVHADQFGEVFLTHANRFPAPPQNLADALRQWLAFHGVTLSFALQWNYSIKVLQSAGGVWDATRALSRRRQRRRDMDMQH